MLEQQFEVVVNEIVAIVEAELKAETANSISDDIPTLVRTLTGTTSMMTSTVACGSSSSCG